MKNVLKRTVIPLALGVAASLAGAAQAAVYHHVGVAGPGGFHGSTTVVSRYGGPRGGVVVVDRGRPGWWVGHPGFVGYYGPRRGFYFAPGYGYYPVPIGFARTTFVVGVVLPPPMRTYVVVDPMTYGLGVAPVGYSWYYAGTGFVLVSPATGMIVQSVAGGW